MKTVEVPKMYEDSIINLRFNQDRGCFAVSLENGVRIYNIDPLVEKVYYDMETVGSIGICEMLFRTNIVALVSGGSRNLSKFPDNVLLLYDDHLKKIFLEIKFGTSIKGVRLRRDKLIVILAEKIHVFSFLHPTRELFFVETKKNEKALCEVSPLQNSQKQVLVFPGHKLGSIQILELSSGVQSYSSAPVYIQAHHHKLGCLAINQQGTKIATASERGTLIRVWDTSTRNKLLEFRRGADPAIIHCLSFSADSDFLCCSSDKGTLHVFAVKDTHLNKTMAGVHPALRSPLGTYGESQWAMATATVPAQSVCICAFGPNNSIYVLSFNGTIHKFSLKTDGSCKQEAFDVFLEVNDDDNSI